jgi:hypothetical protein
VSGDEAKKRARIEIQPRVLNPISYEKPDTLEAKDMPDVFYA